MREIKFKAWDKSQQRMLSVSEPDNQGKREYYPFEVAIGFSHWDKEDITLLQFTGLKDKNGKEIYEGDILKRTGMRDNFHGLLRDTSKSELIVVEIKVTHTEFGLYSVGFSMNTQQTYAERTNPATYEIIGNKFENPDLLTPSK